MAKKQRAPKSRIFARLDHSTVFFCPSKEMTIIDIGTIFLVLRQHDGVVDVGT